MSHATGMSTPALEPTIKKLTVEDLQKIRGAAGADPQIRFRVEVEAGRFRALVEE